MSGMIRLPRGPLDLTRAKKLFAFSHACGVEIDATPAGTARRAGYTLSSATR